MKIFINHEKELRSGWRLTRVIFLAILFLFLLAAVPKLFGTHTIPSEYIFHPSIILAVILALLLERRKFKSVGCFLKAGFLSQTLFGIILAAISVAVIFLGMIITGEIKAGALTLKEIFNQSVLTSIPFWIMVAIAEELLFRGYMISTLMKRQNFWISIIISAILFSSVHFLNPQYNLMAFIGAFLAGILLGYIFVKTGSLWMCVGYHFMWNYLQELLKFPDQGGETITCTIIILNLILIWGISRGSRLKALFHGTLSYMKN